MIQEKQTSLENYTLSWLHISDLHLGGNDKYEEKIIITSLLKSLKERRSQGHVLDFIFFTGDLVKSGKNSEYTDASKYLDALLEATGLSKDRLFVVPGNHDVNRDAGQGLTRTLVDEKESVAFFSPRHPKPHFKKFNNFSKWYNRYFKDIYSFDNKTSCQKPKIINVNDLSIAILPINTALFAADNEDHGKLWVGRRSLNTATSLIEKQDVNLVFGLMHHPPEWLHSEEQDQILTILNTQCDFILHGHIHTNRVSLEMNPESKVIRISAGASYQTRDNINRVLFVKADFKQYEGRILPWRYFDSPKEVWNTDTSMYTYSDTYEGIFQIPAMSRQIITETSALSNKNELKVPFFNFGNVVDREYFINREEELKEAAELIKFKHNFLLVGDFRNGKTSFGKALVHNIMSKNHETDEKTLGCFLNLQHCQELTSETFLEHTIINIIGEISRYVFSCEYTTLIEGDPQEVHPEYQNNSAFKSFLAIYKVIKKRTSQSAVSKPLLSEEFISLVKELMDLIKSLNWNSCFVFYDEANRLPIDLSCDLIMTNCEALIDAGVTTIYSATPRALPNLIDIFNRHIYIGAFKDIKYAKELLVRYWTKNFNRSADDLPVENKAIDRMWTLSRGKPYLLQLLAGYSFRYAKNVGASKVETQHMDAAHHILKKEFGDIF